MAKHYQTRQDAAESCGRAPIMQDTVQPDRAPEDLEQETRKCEGINE